MTTPFIQKQKAHTHAVYSLYGNTIQIFTVCLFLSLHEKSFKLNHNCFTRSSVTYLVFFPPSEQPLSQFTNSVENLGGLNVSVNHKNNRMIGS